MKTLAEEEGMFASSSRMLEKARGRENSGQGLTQSRRGTGKNGFTLLSSISRGTRRGSLLFLSFGMALLFLAASSARANTWTVNTLQDSNDGSCGATCSLRDAITAANSDTSGNVLNTSTAPARRLTVLSYEQVAIIYISTITTLTSGQVNSMDRELNKAYSMALDGKFKGAINNLENFISEVNDLSSSGVLTTEQANTLLGYANDAISLYEQGKL